MKPFHVRNVDVVVVGAGHAGTEAALAAARMGHEVILLTMSLDSVVAMSCNPNIGGTGKGHLVREVDALGGEMALNIDRTFIQSRMLNTSKGPAVHSLRVQADKKAYHREMKKVLEDQERLTLTQGEVVEILTEEGRVTGVRTRTGAVYGAKAVVLATGTYLRGRVYMGELNYPSGPDGHQSAELLSENLMDLGISLMRLKTGTPARIHRDSIDFTGMEIQEGDEEIVPFSMMNDPKDVAREQVPCYLTATKPKMRQVILENINRAAMYLGDIEGTGPRYCPSIEDKVVRFADKETHQVFLEPEGLDTKEIYVQGVSSSFPEEVQRALYREIKGLENAVFMRPAYAIEYDAIDATSLDLSLEHKEISGLFFAGQINGSSGYEEAAAQGIVAGINAALSIEGKEPLILDRSEAYIGVLIDDLVTKGTKEPYRMMTSRAEYRLSLRQDNADFRLTEKGHAVGLATEARLNRMKERKQAVEEEIARLEGTTLPPTEEVNRRLEEAGFAPLKKATSLAELLRRPGLSWEFATSLTPDAFHLSKEVTKQVEIEIKYQGYIDKQEAKIRQFKRLESRLLPEDMDYFAIGGLRNEAKEKLDRIRPHSIGQASRITGVSPADINVLLIALEQRRRQS